MKKLLFFALAICLCSVLALTACTDGSGEESKTGTPSKAPEASKNETSEKDDVSMPDVSMPDVSADISMDMSEIIPNVSDMFDASGTVGDYSDGMLQESKNQ